MPKHVLIIQRRLTEYRVPLFERMRKRLAEAGGTLQVAYGRPNVQEALKRDEGTLLWGIQLPCYYLKVGNAQVVWQPVPLSLFKRQDLVIVTQENQLLFNHWLLLRRRFHRTGSFPRLAFWGHGANFQAARPDSRRERIKSWTTRQVDWWFAYTQASVERILARGFPADRITCLNNAIDTTLLARWRESLHAEEVRSLRSSLGLGGRHVGAFVGSLHAHKRLDFLLAAADKIRHRLPDFELLLLGDGPLRDMVVRYVSVRNWCHWVGARHDREKVAYLSLGHLLLNPGMVGLSILDSFALEIPMVTTRCGLHSPEIAYLESGRNGLMVEDDVEAFAEAVVDLFRDPDRLERMREACVQDAQRYTLDAMVDNFCEGILQACAAEPLWKC